MRSPAKPRLLPILLLGLGLLLGSPAGAQNTPPFSERVDVDIINVDAFVQDASGHAARDLEAEDFEIFEDGKQVEISNFFQNPKTAAPGSPAEDPQASLAASSTPPSPSATPVPAEEGQRLNLVVYIDLYNLRPAHRTQVVKALGLFLEDRIHQGDRILMMTHQRNLQLIHPFTQDLKQVSEGLAKVAKMTTNGQVQDAERLRARKSLLETDYDPIEAIRLFAQQQRLETEVSMQALEATLRSLGGLPGRKALLYVSDGLEKQPGIDLYRLYQDLYSPRERPGLLVRIPLRELTLLPEGDHQKGKLRLYFAVQDPDGAISQVQEIPYPIEIPAAEMENVKDKEIGYAIKLALREGEPKISIGVWDEISGTESYLLRTLQVGKTGKKAAP